MKDRRRGKDGTPISDQLRALMPHRLASRRRANAAALERHEAFLARSASYREALATGRRDFQTVCSGGVVWHVPGAGRKERPDPYAKSVLDGWLPLGQIVNAREFAVGRVMLDIGANIGLTSVTRAILGDFQAVYCAEPHPDNYAALVATVAANGLQGYVLPDRCAIADRDGEMALEVARRIATHELVLGSTEKPTIAVPVRTLDSWVEALGVDPETVDFVKTDCQGWDGRVLAGGPELLRQRHTVWQIEFWPDGVARAGMTVEDVYDLIGRHFTHAVQLGHGASPLAPSALPEALRRYTAKPTAFTDLILFNA